MERYTYMLREIAEQAGLPSLKVLAAQPGMKAAYRVTLYHQQMHLADSIATIKQGITIPDAQVEVVYHGHFENKPLVYKLSAQRYTAITGMFTGKAFDMLRDQEGVAPFNSAICLVERAAGTHVKSVTFAFHKANDAHLKLAETIRTYLPEVLREVAH